jgi:LysM repeat protein
MLAPSSLVFAADPVAAPTATLDAGSTNTAPTPPPAPAAPTPAPIAPADTTTSTERPTTYTMQAGDSLDSIAKKFNTSIRALAKLNKIPHSMYRKLRAGKVLQIPPATSDTSKTDAAK